MPLSSSLGLDQIRKHEEQSRGNGTRCQEKIIEAGDGDDSSQRGGEEEFVGVVEVGEVESGFLGGEALGAGLCEDLGAGDAGEAAGGEGRGAEGAVLDEEEIGGGGFADFVAGVEEERFVEPGSLGGGEGEEVFGVGGAFQPGEGRAFVPHPGAEGEGNRFRSGRQCRGGEEGERGGASGEIGERTGAGGLEESDAGAADGELVGVEEIVNPLLHFRGIGWRPTESSTAHGVAGEVLIEEDGPTVDGEDRFKEPEADGQSTIKGRDAQFIGCDQRSIAPDPFGQGGSRR